MDTPLRIVAPALLGVATVCTAVESLPATYLDDNWSVPIAAAALSHIAGFSVRAIDWQQFISWPILMMMLIHETFKG